MALRKGSDAFNRPIQLGRSSEHQVGAAGRTPHSNLVAELAGQNQASSGYLWRGILGFVLFLVAFLSLVDTYLDFEWEGDQVHKFLDSADEPNISLQNTSSLASWHDRIRDEVVREVIAELRQVLNDDNYSMDGNALELLQRLTLPEVSMAGPSTAVVLASDKSEADQVNSQAMISAPLRNWTTWRTRRQRRNLTWNDYDALIRPIGAFRRLQDKNLHKRRWKWQGAKTGRGRVLSHRTWLILETLASAAFAASWLCGMIPGGFRDGGPRQHAHVGDAGPPFIGTATLKVPPAWSVERSSHYSLRSWISDLVLWSSATDMDVQRWGPVAALQVTGSARELVRELTPEVLSHGIVDPQTGQHISGLMVLVQTLAQRYAPLEQEVSTKSVAEFMAFAKLPNESVDSMLVRFDVLRNRAAQRGGLALNSSGLAWVLLRALQLPPELMDRLLAPIGGQLPQNEGQLTELMGRIRRQGHLFEHGFKGAGRQGATGDPGAYFFPVFEQGAGEGCASRSAYGAAYPSYTASGAWTNAHQTPLAPTGAAPVSSHAGADAVSASQEWGAQCHSCGTFFEDEDISSCTSSEDEGMAESYSAFNTTDPHMDDDAVACELYHQYRVARRKWRRFSGKPPRRYRKFSHKPKDFSRLNKSPYARTYAAFLPASSFAGGKGQSGSGKGKGKGRGNPKGKDGKVLRCNRCNSDQHLWRQCPLVTQGGSAHHVSAQPALTLHTSYAGSGQCAGTREDWGEERSLPGVTFSSHYMSAVSRASGSRTGVDVELERLSQVSSVNKPHKRRASALNNESSEPPSWEPGQPSRPSSVQIRPEDSASQVSLAPSVQRLVHGAPEPKHPPPTHRPNAGRDEQERGKVTVQLQSLLFPWWETDDVTGDRATSSTSHVYHEHTRVKGKVGLLVDPGAHDNLCGAASMELMAEQLGCETHSRQLAKPLNVQGVGKGSQQATTSHAIRFRLHTEESGDIPGSFNTPIVPDSNLPPLLGLRSLRKSKAILDTDGRKLIIPGPGGIQMSMSPGTVVLPLALSESGHLILPVHSEQDSAIDPVKSLDFASSRACVAHEPDSQGNAAACASVPLQR